MNTAHINTTDFSDAGAIVRVIDHKLHEHEATRLIEEFRAYLKNSGKTLVVMDYSAVEFVSSAGLGAMITISQAASEQGAKMVLTGINDDILGVMKLTRLDRLLKIEQNMTKAQKYLLK